MDDHTVEVAVLRVFTDSWGRFGNRLGVIDAAVVAPGLRQAVAAELGYSETVFIEMPRAHSPATARAHIFTPATELPFAGHPTVGAAWWLAEHGVPVKALNVPAGPVQVRAAAELTAVVARAEWAPPFTMHELPSMTALDDATPDDYPHDTEHYLWTWTDAARGQLRSRMFAVNLGVPEDEATGSAAIALTKKLGRDLAITQGRGSEMRTTHGPDGWVTVSGRVVHDGVRTIDVTNHPTANQA